MAIVSVIIPTFNRGALLEKAVESVLSQSFQDAEIVVVDDGSTDDTAERMAKYGNRVTYFRQANAGTSVARNLGLLAARGEFIALLDSDDHYLPDYLEHAVAFLREETDVDFVFADVEQFDADGRVIVPSWVAGKAIAGIPAVARDGDRRIFSRRIFPETIVGSFISMSTLVLRRASLARVGLFDPGYRYLDDTEWLFRLTRACGGGFIARVVARVRAGDDNLTHSRWSIARAETKLRLLRRVQDADVGLDTAAMARLRRNRALMHFELAYWLLRAGRTREARRNAFISLVRPSMSLKSLKVIGESLLPTAMVRAMRRTLGKES